MRKLREIVYYINFYCSRCFKFFIMNSMGELLKFFVENLKFFWIHSALKNFKFFQHIRAHSGITGREIQRFLDSPTPSDVIFRVFPT